MRLRRNSIQQTSKLSISEADELSDNNEDKLGDNVEGSIDIKQLYHFDGKEFATYKSMVDAKRKRNHNMLVKSGLLEAVASVKHLIKKKKDNAQQRIKRNRITKPKASDAPRRRSNRLAGVQSDGHYVDDERNGKFSIIVEGTSVNASTSLLTQKEVFYQNRINDGSGLSICQAVELND